MSSEKNKDTFEIPMDTPEKCIRVYEKMIKYNRTEGNLYKVNMYEEALAIVKEQLKYK